MKQIFALAIFLGSILLVGINAAHATCVRPFDAAGGALPPNDVFLEAPFASASAPLSAFEVDMNGVQRGLKDQLPWATHGTLVALASATAEIELITSWTQNEGVDSVEWVCRFKQQPGTPLWLGSGFYHSSASTYGIGNIIQRCTLDLASDC